MVWLLFQFAAVKVTVTELTVNSDSSPEEMSIMTLVFGEVCNTTVTVTVDPSSTVVALGLTVNAAASLLVLATVNA